jgi:hypothetical protein
MFKKMHSIEFDEGTNLMHYIRDSQPNKIDPNFFRKRILQGNKLIYKNKDGKLIEIIDFGRDEDGIYFTRERKYS